MSADFVLIVSQFITALLFVLVCEFLLKRRYEPDYTAVLATVGIAQVGLLVAARLAWAPLPALDGPALTWWLWWLIFWSFIAAAIPIWIWQLVIQGKRWRKVNTAWERWNKRGDA